MLFGEKNNSIHNVSLLLSMRKWTGIYCVVFVAGLVFSCSSTENTKEEALYESKEWTSDVFTEGIEGPAYHSSGFLYVVNFQKEGTIGKVDSAGNVSVFVTLPEGSIGNGIRFSKDQKTMFVADYLGHNIIKVNMDDQAVEIYAHTDSLINQPNDIAIDASGNIFASDPNWADSTGNLWYIGANRKFKLLESNMGTTNGVEVSPDNSILYVNESIQRKVWAYDINNNGTISNKRLLHEFEDFGMDGMRCDAKGNLYIARYGKGEVAVLSPEGKLIKSVQLNGQRPTNVAFGGKDNKTLFVTLQDTRKIEKLEVAIEGAKR